MKDYIWQRLANPVERALVRTGLMRVLHDLLDAGGASRGAAAPAAEAVRQAMAYAERFALVTAHEPVALTGTDGRFELDATALAQLFVDPAYAALAARYEAWHRESAPRLFEDLKRADRLHDEEALTR
jgi:hypothetical protein